MVRFVPRVVLLGVPSARLRAVLLAVAALAACGGRHRAQRPAKIENAGLVEPAPASSAPAPPVMDDPDPVLAPETLAALRLHAPSPLPPPPADASNRFADDARAALFGRRLFFDPRFSGKLIDGDNDGSVRALGKKGETGKVACAGCHLPATVFADSRSVQQQTSLGAGWGLRRAPSLLDVGQSRVLMWDGRRDALYNQVFGPIESEIEMNSSRLYAAEQVFAHHRAEYEALFGTLPPLGNAKRFPPLPATRTGCDTLDTTPKCTAPVVGAPGDHGPFDALAPADQDAVTRVVVNVGKAIAAYERLLACGAGKFDRWMNGDAAAMSRSEQRGAALFVGKGRCADCHKGPFFSDERFHNVGLKPTPVATVFLDANDEGASLGLSLALRDTLNVKGKYSDGYDGRLPENVDPAMKGAFRTPRLRCSSRRPSFMHTGQLRTIDDVVSFFNRGGDPYGYPGKNELRALDLSARERADLVAFVAALDGPGPPAELLAPP
jgi:cytochrome c peroxidase